MIYFRIIVIPLMYVIVAMCVAKSDPTTESGIKRVQLIAKAMVVTGFMIAFDVIGIIIDQLILEGLL